MNETKHTPGPIHLHPLTWQNAKGRPVVAILSQSGRHLGEVGHTRTRDWADAERLVLAWNCHDPLMVAIQDLCQAIDEHERRPDYFDGLRHAQEKAEAALALTQDH